MIHKLVELIYYGFACDGVHSKLGESLTRALE